MGVAPLQIAFSDADWAAIRARVAGYEWHEMPDVPEGGDRWAYGTDMRTLRQICDHWVGGYDWQRLARRLGAWPNFTTEIDGQAIHFLHIKSPAANATPLLLTHGWPGSVLEFLDVIGPLAARCDLVIPSLPGYGLSGKPKTPIGPRATAALWDRLMREELGYASYIAQGGDWGAVVTGWLGARHGLAQGGGCRSIHLNMFALRAPVPPQTPEEQAWAAEQLATREREGAYLRLQMTKPQTLSYAMMDSPVGVAAWIVEKFHRWSDRRGADGSDRLDNAFSTDDLLDNIMLYLLTRSFNTATWFYRGAMEEGTVLPAGSRVEVPTGVAVYPAELFKFPPRRLAEQSFNVVRWTELDHGGHFAAMETKAAFAAEVLGFVDQVAGTASAR